MRNRLLILKSRGCFSGESARFAARIVALQWHATEGNSYVEWCLFKDREEMGDQVHGVVQ